MNNIQIGLSKTCHKELFNIKAPFLFICIFVFIINPAHADKTVPIKNFLNTHFENNTPKPQRIWINKDKQKEIKSKINPNKIKLSYRYWNNNENTVFILDEIGKERDITTGILIKNNTIKTVEVLVYRESRGGQVQNPRFTQQYYQKNQQSNLAKEIDSISGATLSVNALNKQVKLALLLNNYRLEASPQNLGSIN